MLQAIAKLLIHSQHFPYFLQITHYKTGQGTMQYPSTPPPFNVEAGVVECHCEFRATLLRGGGGGTSNTMVSV